MHVFDWISSPQIDSKKLVRWKSLALVFKIFIPSMFEHLSVSSQGLSKHSLMSSQVPNRNSYPSLQSQLLQWIHFMILTIISSRLFKTRLSSAVSDGTQLPRRWGWRIWTIENYLTNEMSWNGNSMQFLGLWKTELQKGIKHVVKIAYVWEPILFWHCPFPHGASSSHSFISVQVMPLNL